jgi:hypothetical protein
MEDPQVVGAQRANKLSILVFSPLIADEIRITVEMPIV